MIHAQTKNINESKLKTTFKPMIALDKNRNFYTCACKTNFLLEGSKYSTHNIFQKTKRVKKYILTKRIWLTGRTTDVL